MNESQDHGWWRCDVCEEENPPDESSCIHCQLREENEAKLKLPIEGDGLQCAVQVESLAEAGGHVGQMLLAIGEKIGHGKREPFVFALTVSPKR